MFKLNQIQVSFWMLDVKDGRAIQIVECWCLKRTFVLRNLLYNTITDIIWTTID